MNDEASDHHVEPDGSLTQVNVRLPRVDCDALRHISDEGGTSLNALLGAVVHEFLQEHSDEVPDHVLAHARRIDSSRRRRPHLKRLHRQH